MLSSIPTRRDVNSESGPESRHAETFEPTAANNVAIGTRACWYLIAGLWIVMLHCVCTPIDGLC